MRQLKQKFVVASLVALLSAANAVWAEDEAPEPAVETSAANQLDSLNLDTTSITGSQELPKVLYIVPWKQASIGDLSGKPVNSLLDEVLTPLDRDVFRRQVRYFDQLYVAAETDTAQDE